MNRQKSFDNSNPTLYLVATPIGNLSEVSYRVITTLKEVDYIAAEDTRVTIKLLNHYDINTKLISHHEHNLNTAITRIIGLLEQGNNIALVSDAGYPAISDPGYELVSAAIEKDINVVVVNGPNAALGALVVSGIAPQPFMFYGFLDHKDKNKRKQLEKLKKYEETIILYESPHRISKTLELMLSIMGDRKIALARELTKKHEEIIRGNISEVLTVAAELKGEMVIVVSGNKETKDVEFNNTVIEHINELIELGLSSREAIKEVAKIRNLKKSDVYNEYHTIKEDR
ncbi:MAG: 16S rRNA (cytidine(1402)-2'-O)-methyltransferase [Erysipelotrichaceae bacterium]|nr:16S rRNA (cytidine(1402)-2'-O)-methyltransferase [Erysipelotrichaceae bacterium]MDD3810111.1 16S rRNA (cytidine(1402)-2'-O)-methyltransferase [Erysipelotrichaceae bacterium]